MRQNYCIRHPIFKAKFRDKPNGDIFIATGKYIYRYTVFTSACLPVNCRAVITSHGNSSEIIYMFNETEMSMHLPLAAFCWIHHFLGN